MAGHRAGGVDPAPGADGLRQDAGRVPHRHRPPDARGRGGKRGHAGHASHAARAAHAGALRLAAQGARGRRRAQPAGAARGHRRAGPARRSRGTARPGSTFARATRPPGSARACARAPADILITTPESLYLLLTSSSAREGLASVDTVIVDEIHALVPSKRGAHLALSLERLEALRPAGGAAPPAHRPERDAAAARRGGAPPRGVRARRAASGDDRRRRSAARSSSSRSRQSRRCPRARPTGRRRSEGTDAAASTTRSRSSLWPGLHARVVELVRAHRSTIVFVNSRRLAERLAAALNDLGAARRVALAHHGSLAREKRAAIEERLKRGELRAIVATSSLELGIDMGAVDLVVQIEAPTERRVGPAAHRARLPRRRRRPARRPAPEAPAGSPRLRRRGREHARAARSRRPSTRATRSTSSRSRSSPPWRRSRRWRATTSSSASAAPRPSPTCPRGAFDGVLDMLSGRYPSDDFAELRPRITWDRTRGRVDGPRGSQRLAVTNGGTIPDRGLYGVFTAAGRGSGRRHGRTPRGRARRGDGLRAARGRGVPARRLVVARRADHARPGRS